MLDAVPERVIAGLPNAPEPISLLLEPVQAGLPAVSVTATLARRGDGWVGLQFSRLNRDVMDYFALALLLHEAGGGGAPLPASLLPDQRHELDTEQRDRRSRTIHSLMLDVQRVAGLEIGAAIQAKLARIVDAAPLDEVANWADRLSTLDGDHPEWVALVEMLTVHETYLYREPAQLALLQRSLVERLGTARERRLCLWSAGCSTGEEVWTLCILALSAMVEAGLARESGREIRLDPRWQLEVVGTDISRQVLGVAKAGVYPMGDLSAFRALPPGMERFFPEGEARNTRRVRDDLRAFVRFAHGNLVRDPPPVAQADAVLCRNVLIYFPDLVRAAVQRRLVSALAPGGLLALGGTDRVLIQADLDPVEDHGALIFRRR
ncbi:MAG: methyltransferase [Alphaproteobacteria bacterium]|nr:MAG: methyltransferase [Alphaproteobacteria bacterium]